MRSKFFAVAAVALSGTACDTYMCDTGIFPAIQVEIRDSVTNAPAAAGAIVIATSGSFTDSMSVTHDLMVGLAQERAGTYTVRVRKTGYRLWSRSGVEVRGGECGVTTVNVLARLHPE
ncbi:MAG TPA: hypothetical protein VGC44_13880 [Longimicrobiales bacterium]